MTSVYVTAIVAVLIDGVFTPSVPPATLARGHVMAPPQLIAAFADRVSIGARSSLVAERGVRRCTSSFDARDGAQRVALAPLVRCLGGELTWHGTSRTVAIAFAAIARVESPPPFDPARPQVAPTAIFTPEPAPPTPRAVDTGSPRPRRTAIPVTPSWPIASIRPRPSAP